MSEDTVYGLTDPELRQIVGASRREDLASAVENWLYLDPRFSSNREAALGTAMVRRMVAQLKRGGD